MAKTKECLRCGEVKQTTDFYRTRRLGKILRQKVCKACVRARRSELDAMSPEERAAAVEASRAESAVRWARISDAIAAHKAWAAQ